MDLLACPADPVSVALDRDKTPYLCREPWDGGLFRTYAHRKSKTSIIPPMLRHVSGVPPAEQPYLESLYPTPREELQPFLQTWFFFGTLAEMLGLNEIEPGGIWLMDRHVASAEIAQLHTILMLDEGDGESPRFLTAARLLSWAPLFRERLALATDQFQRLSYLCHCLQYCSVLLSSIDENVDHNVRYSIAALGEFFTTGLYASATLSRPIIRLPVLGYFWNRNYLRDGDGVEALMLQNGWCPSEVDKIRSQVQGLHTMHYTSRLKKALPWLDHSRCSRSVCCAFQLHLATYTPAHASEPCACALLDVDESVVSATLAHSDSYPVIRVENYATGDLSDVEVHVEAYRGDVPYVWANGLGNPRSTALPRCQIARVARLVAALPPAPGTTETPRLWLDTLCCPIEPRAKLIALARIADVYRKAHHVLVLDTSLTAFRYEASHPAELLVRAFVCSPWMRRLWTLQEGALGRVLQIQFADQAANNMTLLTELFQIAREDARYMRIWQDINHEYNQLLGFSPKTGPENTIVWAKPSLSTLQRALHFRTVSVASDEPLCISTLMNLDTGYIASALTLEKRMVRVWEKLAQSHGGISTRVLFYLEEKINIPGWRWAPKSLLASSVGESVLTLDERAMRFHTEHRQSMGVPTSLGLRITLPGYRLIPESILPGFPLHPWPKVISPSEDQILLQNEETGEWFRIVDWYRAKKLPSWTRQECRAFDRSEDHPLCRAVDTGRCAILVDDQIAMEDTRMGCLLQVEEMSRRETAIVGYTPGPSESCPPLRAHRERSVILSRLTVAESQMMSMMRHLAEVVARNESTAAYVEVQEKFKPGSTEWSVAEEKVRQNMKQVMRAAWLAHPEVLQQTIKDTVGESMDDYVWTLIPKLFSHKLVLRGLKKEQVLFVD
ncbi:hypothetical protein E4U42_000494 [Claviceps africana]|uniref:Heterokaryon incompatibility domain-containing protein n=1 Tax=Claviceps africana TaxID=83212 RepID=A0A8K0JCU0_9HYPO|nr:hypothetical protein E4U42_000494 [Claviceps africana]